MKRIAILAAAALAVTAFAQDKKAPEAAKAPPPPKGVAAAEGATITATVESIDQATRAVTLKGPRGNLVSFVAGPEVKNLAQVSKGDQVHIAYVQALALELKKSASKTRERTETEFKKGAEPGQMPAGIVGRKVKVVASVEGIDTKNQLVTLRGPQHTVDLKVKDPAVLKTIKIGDHVEATYVEAIAVKVEKAAPAPAPMPEKAPPKK